MWGLIRRDRRRAIAVLVPERAPGTSLTLQLLVDTLAVGN
jgi:hypothetical protein